MNKENKIKSSRHRKPKFIRESMWQDIERDFPEVPQARLAGMAYALHVTLLIKNIKGIEYLCKVDHNKKEITIKESILAELGKLHDDELIKKVALKICKEAKEIKRTTKGWINYIRTFRDHSIAISLSNGDHDS